MKMNVNIPIQNYTIFFHKQEIDCSICENTIDKDRVSFTAKDDPNFTLCERCYDLGFTDGHDSFTTDMDNITVRLFEVNDECVCVCVCVCVKTDGGRQAACYSRSCHVRLFLNYSRFHTQSLTPW